MQCAPVLGACPPGTRTPREPRRFRPKQGDFFGSEAVPANLEVWPSVFVLRIVGGPPGKAREDFERAVSPPAMTLPETAHGPAAGVLPFQLPSSYVAAACSLRTQPDDVAGSGVAALLVAEEGPLCQTVWRVAACRRAVGSRRC